MTDSRFWPELSVYLDALVATETDEDRLRRLLEVHTHDEDSPPVLSGSDAFGNRVNNNLVITTPATP